MHLFSVGRQAESTAKNSKPNQQPAHPSTLSPSSPLAAQCYTCAMKLHLLTAALLLPILSSAASAAGPPIELELVTEQGLQITAPQQWLQLLAGIGIEQVQIRGSRPGDQPQVSTRGSGKSTSYKVVGVLTARDQLVLPGATFTKGDRAKLKDYFAQLGADGADSVTATRIRFGLTEKELTAVLADLSPPLTFETKGQTPQAIVDRLQTKLSLKPTIDQDAAEQLRTAAPMADELTGISAGTAFAITLRSCGLVMHPEKERGQPVTYRVSVASPDTLRQRTRGRPADADLKYWPIGWEPDKSPGEVAPSLFQPRNAEIDGYSLEEALGAIGPLLKVPLLLDRVALKANHIDPAKIQVKLAKTRTTYKRVIDRILSQPHLGSEIRVDEAGMPFLWITR